MANTMTKPTKKSGNSLIIFFYILIAVLVAFFVIITLKIAFVPICATDTQHSCVVDPWSIVGLTAAVFGIAATLLTFLAAFAVAYWWANLDERIEQRANVLIEQGLKEQQALFQTLIAENVKVFEAKIAETVKTFDVQTSQLEARLEATNKDMIIAITTSLDPWTIENWASELLAVDPSSEVALRMVLSYLQEVDAHLPNPPLSKRNALYFSPSRDPLYYWEKALKWQRSVIKQSIQVYVNTAAHQIDRRKPQIEEYKKQKAEEA